MALLATLGRLDNQEHSFYQELFQYAQFGKHPKQLEKFLDTHEENNFNIDYRNSEGQTALYVACLCGNEKIGNVLLKYGADCNARNSRNMTPVHVAAGSDRCSKEFLRFMLQNHAGDLRIKDDQNRRPFDLLSENLEFEKRQKGGLFSSINSAKKIQEDKKKFIEKVTAMQEALTALNTKQKIQGVYHKL